MKKNRRKLVLVQLFSALGNAVVGVFLPFLFARAFDLVTWEVVFGVAGIQVLMMLLVYPINRLLRAVKTRDVIRLGFVFQASFLAVLALAPDNKWWAILAAVLYVLYLVIYWPSWHVASLNSSRDGTRGSFTGNIQVMMVGANLVAPLLAGVMLEKGLDSGVLALSLGLFLFAILMMRRVDLPMQKLSSFGVQWRVFVNSILKTRHVWGMMTEGVQSGTLWILWPVFLGAVLGSFSQMGLVVAIAAIAEVISAKVFGVLTDKKSSRRVLNFGQWFRVADLAVRGALMWFPTMMGAAIVSVNAGLLGPVFNISIYGRTCEIAEEVSPRELEWFIAREWVLAGVRFLWLILAAGAVYLWGDIVLGWSLIISGLMSFGFRRF